MPLDRRRFLEIIALGLLWNRGARATILDDAFVAVREGDVEVLRKLLERGLDPDSVDLRGNTLLIQSIQHNNLAIVRLLLAWRARPNRRNQHGDTALRVAALTGQIEIVKALVSAGAEVNMSGWTPLIYAAFNGHIEVVSYLLDQGAQIDAVSEANATALMVAARNGHLETVKRLLRAHAEPNHVNELGETAIDWAAKSGHTDIVEWIERAGGVSGDEIHHFELRQKN